MATVMMYAVGVKGGGKSVKEHYGPGYNEDCNAGIHQTAELAEGLRPKRGRLGLPADRARGLSTST